MVKVWWIGRAWGCVVSIDAVGGCYGLSEAPRWRWWFRSVGLNEDQ